MAADLTQSFMGKHVEKVVLAAAVVVFVGSATWFVVLREPQDQLPSQTRRLVQKVQEDVKNPSIDKALTQDERVKLGIDRSVTTAAEFGRALNGLPAAWTAVAKMVPPQPTRKEEVIVVEEVKPPAEILAVEDFRTVWGRGVTSDEVEMALEKSDVKSGSLSDIVWAGCIARFDLTEQLKRYALPRKYILEQSPVTITKVELRRRERQPDGGWSDWKAVPATVPADVADELPTFPDDPSDKLAVRAWGGGLIKAQAEVRRTPFYELVVVDPEGKTVEAEAGSVDGVANPDPSVFEEKEPGKPADEKASAEKKPASAKKETASKKTAADAAASPWLVTPTGKKPTKGGPTPGEQTAAAEHVYATVWANDGTVQPGKTYQYQMRVAVLNPVWSRPEVKDEQARWALQFEGPWSEAGEEVTIPGLVAFYFVGTFGQRVNLELHRWIHGQWIMIPSVPTLLGAPVSYTKRVPISVGGEQITKDVDLSPQTLVVDVVKGFPYKPAGGNRSISTNVLVYADARGSVRERIEWEDRLKATDDRRRRKEATPPPETGKRSKRSKRTSKR